MDEFGQGESMKSFKTKPISGASPRNHGNTTLNRNISQMMALNIEKAPKNKSKKKKKKCCSCKCAIF